MTEFRELPIDWRLETKHRIGGGFSESLDWKDRQRLRAITRKVHMQHYPSEMISDYEADRIIDVMAPETQRYLIDLLWEKVK
jgi:hypothetical protein